MSTTKLAIIILTAVFLMGVSWHPATPSSQPAHQIEQGVTHSLTLVGAFLTGWNGTNPGPTITAAMGDSVSLTLRSGDGLPHTFIVDVDKDGVISSPNCTVDKCSSMFTTMTSFTFPVNFAPGTYTYYCSVHLTYMVGTFIVTSPPPPTAPATFVHSKLSWTHHLSLMKDMGMQTFTAHVLDTGSSNTIAIVHVKGIGSAFSAESDPTTLQPGVVTDITFMSAVAGFVETKVCFTATLTFGPTTGLENTSPLTKTGCFKVVP